MINPDNKLGVNAAFQGRTTPNAFNAVLQTLSGRGIVSGFEVAPSSGMTLTIGANDGIPDVAIVQDDIGNRLAMVTRSTIPIEQTIAEAPETGSRIDAIVVYTNNPPEVLEQIPTADNPTICAMLVVQGEASENPIAPDDAAIRTAITADEASGATAYYAVIAYVTVENGVTDITSGEIEAGPKVAATANLQPGANIQIDGTTISATNTTYTAGNGLSLTGTAFAADLTVLASVSSVNAKAVGTTETYTIADTDWAEAAGISPFTYSTNISSSYTILDSSIVELINNQAVLFANYGFAIGSVSSSSGNLFDKTTVTTGCYLDNTGGVVTGYAGFVISDYIPVTALNNYTYQGSTIGPGYGSKIGLYDSSKTWVGYRDINLGTSTLYIPSGVAYIRITVSVDTLDSFQFEEGSTASAYTPYTGDGHSITLYALDAPTTSVTLKINYKEGA